jgi:hypothetical protein
LDVRPSARGAWVRAGRTVHVTGDGQGSREHIKEREEAISFSLFLVFLEEEWWKERKVVVARLTTL